MRAEHAWFPAGRFGLFVHWGLHALAARHEWVTSREQVPLERYEPTCTGRCRSC